MNVSDKTVSVAQVPSLEVGQQLRLLDGANRILGAITIVEIKGALILGDFHEASDYRTVKPLFEEFVEAANEMQFSRVDEIDREIETLQLRLDAEDGRPVPPIEDVQIGGSAISFRVPSKEPLPPANGQGGTVS